MNYSKRNQLLGELLEDLYEKYNRPEYVDPDPLVFLYDYERPSDREIVGLISSSLAFGTVKQITNNIKQVLGVMGQSPLDFLLDNGTETIKKKLSGFKHRWVTGDDLASLLSGTRRALEKFGSLEACFMDGFEESESDVIPALTGFVSEISDDVGFSCSGFIPSPCRESSCKRLNLFLRWMVRNDRVDPGGWKDVPASMLIVPLDTHMYRLGKVLGFTGRRQANLRTAREITEAFREFAPSDPVKYDFALTRLGIRKGEGQEEFLNRLKRILA